MFNALIDQQSLEEHERMEKQEMIANAQAMAKLREYKEKERTRRVQYLDE